MVSISSKISIHSSGIIRMDNFMMMLYMDFKFSAVSKILFSFCPGIICDLSLCLMVPSLWHCPFHWYGVS